MTDYTIHDAESGQQRSGQFDQNDPNSIYQAGVYQSASNQGIDGKIPGWAPLTRYLVDNTNSPRGGALGELLRVYQQWSGPKDGSDLGAFWDSAEYKATTNGIWWHSMDDRGREEEIYKAGQRIQGTFAGDPEATTPDMKGSALTYPLADGHARWVAEERLGVAHGSVY